METLIVYVNDSEYARNQLATMIDAQQPTKCVLIAASRHCHWRTIDLWPGRALAA